MTDWTTCRVVRDRDGELWFRIRGDMWFDGDVRIGSEGLGSNYGPLTPVLDADGLPVVRTVGDLTARHVGRRARIGKTPPAALMGLSWSKVGIWVYLFTPDAEAARQNLPLDTPCEVFAWTPDGRTSTTPHLPRLPRQPAAWATATAPARTPTNPKERPMSDQPTKYRKKPVVIDAIHWREHLTPPEAHALTNIIEREWGYPWLVGNALRPDTLRCESQPHASERPTKGVWIDPADGALMIRTLEGDMKVSLGDYIIRGVQGEVYPCKPDIFAATYEPADADDHAQPKGEPYA